MARLTALLTALDLIRAVGWGLVTGLDWDRITGLGLDPVRDRGLDRARGLGLDRAQDRGLVPAMVRVPITGRVLDLLPALLALLRLVIIRLSRLSPRQRILCYLPEFVTFLSSVVVCGWKGSREHLPTSIAGVPSTPRY